MKQFIYILFLTLIFPTLFAQEETVESFDYIDSFYDSTVYKKESSAKQKKKLDVGMDVSMGYTFSSGGYGGPMLMFSPNVTYPLTNKFSLVAGVSVGHGSFYNPYVAEYGSDPMLPMTRMFIYAGGNYQVNDRLSINGTMYKQILDVPNQNPSRVNTNFDSNGGSLGFKYKITPGISFGAQIRVQDQGFYSPYNNFNSYGNYRGGAFGPNWW